MAYNPLLAADESSVYGLEGKLDIPESAFATPEQLESIRRYEELKELYRQDMEAEQAGKPNLTADGKRRVWSLANPKDPGSIQYTEVGADEKLGSWDTFKAGAAHNIGRGVGVAAGVGAGAAAGAATGAALTSWSGPGSLVGAGVGAAVGTVASLLAGWAGDKAQRAVEKRIWTPEERQHRDAIRQIAAEEHKVANWVGETAPDLVAMALPTGWATGGASAVKGVARMATRSAIAGRALGKGEAKLAEHVATALGKKYGGKMSASMLQSAAKTAAREAVKNGGKSTERAILKATREGLSVYATPAVSHTVRGHLRFGEKGREAAIAAYDKATAKVSRLEELIRGNASRLNEVEKLGIGATEAEARNIAEATQRILGRGVTKEGLQRTVARQTAALGRARTAAEKASKALGGNFLGKAAGNATAFAAFNAGGAGAQLAEAGKSPMDGDFWWEGIKSAGHGMRDGAILGFTGSAMEHLGGKLGESAFGKGVMSKLERMSGWNKLSVTNKDRARAWLKPFTGYTLGILGAVPEGVVAGLTNYAIETSLYATGATSEKPKFSWEDTWKTVGQFAFFKAVFGIKSLPAQRRAVLKEAERKREQYGQYRKLRQEEWEQYRNERMKEEAPVADYDTYWAAQERAELLENMYRHHDRVMGERLRDIIGQSAKALGRVQEALKEGVDANRQPILEYLIGASDRLPDNLDPELARATLKNFGFPEVDIENFIGKDNARWAGTRYGPAESRPYANGIPRIEEQQKARLAEIAKNVGMEENGGSIFVDTGERNEKGERLYIAYGMGGQGIEDGKPYAETDARRIANKRESNDKAKPIRFVTPETKAEEVSWERQVPRQEAAQQPEEVQAQAAPEAPAVQPPAAYPDTPEFRAFFAPAEGQQRVVTRDVVFWLANDCIKRGVQPETAAIGENVRGTPSGTSILTLVMNAISRDHTAESFVASKDLAKEYPELRKYLVNLLGNSPDAAGFLDKAYAMRHPATQEATGEQTAEAGQTEQVQDIAAGRAHVEGIEEGMRPDGELSSKSVRRKNSIEIGRENLTSSPNVKPDDIGPGGRPQMTYIPADATGKFAVNVGKLAKRANHGATARDNMLAIEHIGDVLDGSMELPEHTRDARYRMAKAEIDGELAYVLLTIVKNGTELESVEVLHGLNTKRKPAGTLHQDSGIADVDVRSLRVMQGDIAEFDGVWQELFKDGMMHHNAKSGHDTTFIRDGRPYAGPMNADESAEAATESARMGGLMAGKSGDNRPKSEARVENIVLSFDEKSPFDVDARVVANPNATFDGLNAVLEKIDRALNRLDNAQRGRGNNVLEAALERSRTVLEGASPEQEKKFGELYRRKMRNKSSGAAEAKAINEAIDEMFGKDAGRNAPAGGGDAVTNRAKAMRDRLRTKRNAVLYRMREMAETVNKSVIAELKAQEAETSADAKTRKALRRVALDFMAGTHAKNNLATRSGGRVVARIANSIRLVRAVQQAQENYGGADAKTRFGILLKLSLRLIGEMDADTGIMRELSDRKTGAELRGKYGIPEGADPERAATVVSAMRTAEALLERWGIEYGTGEAKPEEMEGGGRARGGESDTIRAQRASERARRAEDEEEQMLAEGGPDSFYGTESNDEGDYGTGYGNALDFSGGIGTARGDKSEGGITSRRDNAQVARMVRVKDRTKFADAFKEAFGLDGAVGDEAAAFLARLFEKVPVRNANASTRDEAMLYLRQRFGEEVNTRAGIEYANRMNEGGKARVGSPFLDRGGTEGEFAAERLLPENGGSPQTSDEARAIADDLLFAMGGSDKNARVTIGRKAAGAELRKKSGQAGVGGYDPKTGELWLSSETATKTTAAHEPVHFLVEMVRRVDPKAAERLMKLVETAPQKVRAEIEERLEKYRKAGASEAELAEEGLAIAVSVFLRENGRIDRYLADRSAVAWFKNATRVVDGTVKSSMRGVSEAARRYLAAKGWISYNGPASITLDDILNDKFATVEDLANALWDVMEEGGRIRIAKEEYQSMPLDRLQALAKERGLKAPANRMVLIRHLTEQDKANGRRNSGGTVDSANATRLELRSTPEEIRRMREAVRRAYGIVTPGENGGFEARDKNGRKLSRREFPTPETAERFAARKVADAELHEPKGSKNPFQAMANEHKALAEDIAMLQRDAIGPREGGVQDASAPIDAAKALELIAARGEHIRDLMDARADVAGTVDAGLAELKSLGIDDPRAVAKFQKRMLSLYGQRDQLKAAERAEEIKAALVDGIKETAARKNLREIESICRGRKAGGVSKSAARTLPQDTLEIAQLDAADVEAMLSSLEERIENPKEGDNTADLEVRRHIVAVVGGILNRKTVEAEDGLDFDRIRAAKEQLGEIAQKGRDAWMEEHANTIEKDGASRKKMLEQLDPSGKGVQQGSLATTKQDASPVKRAFNSLRSLVNAGATLWDLLDRRTAKDGKTRRLSGEGQVIHNAEGDAEELRAERDKFDWRNIAKIAAKWLGGKVNEDGEMDEATRRKFAKEWGRSADKGKIGRYKVVEVELPELDADGDPVLGADGNVVMRKTLKSVRIGDADGPMVELLSVLLHMKEAEALAKQEYTDNPEKVDGADTSLMRGMVENGYTKELYEDLKRELPESLQNAGEELVEYLAKEGRPVAQQAYWKEYGAVLRIHDRYFPLSRMNYGAAKNEFDRRSVPSIIRSFMKQRTVNDHDLRPVNAFEAAVQHMRQVRQVEAYQDLVRFCKNTVLHPEMQRAIDQFLPGTRERFNNHVMRMAHGGISGMSDSIVWKVRKAMTSANVLTTSVMVKQLMSWPMMCAHLPDGVSKREVFAEAMKLTATDPFGIKTRALWAKGVDEGGFPYYKFRRQGNMSFDMRVFNDVNFANKLMNSKWSPAQIMAKAVELGDALAFTNIGEATRRVQMRHELEKYALSKGIRVEEISREARTKITEKCNRELKRRIEMSQQSGALKDVSDAQAGPISGLFYNFATAPMAIGRLFENDVRNLLSGVDVKESAFSLATIWIAQALYQAAKDGFWTGDDDERKRERRANQVKTFLSTPLSAAMPVASTADYLYSRLTGGRTYGGWAASVMPWTDVFESMSTAVADIGKLLGLNDNVHADAERMGLDITKAIGQLTGQPLGGLYKNGAGLYHAIHDDNLAAGQRIFMPVLSPYAVGAGKKPRK